MAVLADADRVAVWEDFMRKHIGGIALSKIELRDAFNAADDWVDTNSASFNNALPAAAKANLTAGQKAQLLVLVTKRRWEVG